MKFKNKSDKYDYHKIKHVISYDMPDFIHNLLSTFQSLGFTVSSSCYGYDWESYHKNNREQRDFMILWKGKYLNFSIHYNHIDDQYRNGIWYIAALGKEYQHLKFCSKKPWKNKGKYYKREYKWGEYDKPHYREHYTFDEHSIEDWIKILVNDFPVKGIDVDNIKIVEKEYVYEWNEVIKIPKIQHNNNKLKPYCQKVVNYSKQYIFDKNLHEPHNENLKSCRKHFKSSLRFKMKQELEQEYTDFLTLNK
jgi:hypothetical protein